MSLDKAAAIVGIGAVLPDAPDALQWVMEEPLDQKPLNMPLEWRNSGLGRCRPVLRTQVEKSAADV